MFTDTMRIDNNTQAHTKTMESEGKHGEKGGGREGMRETRGIGKGNSNTQLYTYLLTCIYL